MNTARAQPFLSNHKTESFRTQQIFLRHPAGLIQDFGMAEIITACMTHDRDISDQVKTWRIGRHDDHAGPKMGRRFRVGYCHHDGKGRTIGRTGIPLLSINHIVRTVFDSGRIHHDGIGARQFHFCHGEATPDLSVYKGLEIFFLLCFRPVFVENFDISRIRRLTAEDIMPQGRPAQNFRHQGVFHQVQSHSPVFLRMVGGPELHLFHHPPLFGQFGNHRFEIFRQKFRLQRNQFSFDKFRHHADNGLHFFRYGKIHHQPPLKLCKTGSPFATRFLWLAQSILI